MAKSTKSMIMVAGIALVISLGVVVASKKVKPFKDFLD